MKFALAINEEAGKGQAKRIAHDLQDELARHGHDSIIISADSVGEMRQRLTDIVASNDHRGIVSIGGDGMAHLVINACAETTTPMYCLPAGTGNDFARTNNEMTQDVTRIAQRLVGEAPRPIDLARIEYATGSHTNYEFFGQVLSTGFDSLVNRRANRMSWMKGQMKYNIATLLELPLFRPLKYKLTIDGRSFDSEAMLVAVANGPTYGGGMKILPEADRRDGLLDILLLKPVSKFELLRVFPRVFKGTHVTHPAVEIFRGKKVALQASSLAYADGEYISELPIEISIRPKALLTWESA